MATNAQAIGVVSAARGEVFARAADGQMRRLAVGDQVFEGDVIVTASGSSAEITTFDGPVLSVAEQQTMVVDDQVLTTAPDATAGAVAPLDSTEAAKVIQTVSPDANALLEDEAAAAGLTAGDTSEGGHNFVDLLRIVEAVPTAAYAFPINPTGAPPVIEGELGVPATPVISVNVQIGGTVTTPIEGGGVPIINLPPGVAAVGASGAQVLEGSSGGYVPVTFYITLDKAFTQDVTVTYRIDPGTATYGNPAGSPPVPGGDFFDGGLTGTVTIPAGYIGFAVTENIVGDKVVEPNETFSITLVSANGATINPSAASAVVTIVNDDFAPVASNDAIAITDPSAAGSTNVLTNDSDQNGDSLSVTAPVSVVNEFGTLTIGTNGAATFVLNEAGQAMAKALDAGQSHVITFNNVYQATDGFNPSNPASVTVTVLGINDPPSITVNPPVGGQAIVYEAGLDGGSQLGPVTTSTSGSFTLADPDGMPDIKTVSVVVGSDTYTVNIGDLAGHAFQGAQGVLTVTAFNAQTGVASYTYQLTNPVTSSPASNDGGNTEAQGDVFTLTTSDGDVSSAPATITIAIVDDVPVAVGDGAQAVVEDGLLSVNGNVLSNDSYGADLPGSFAWDANTAAKAALAQYGTLTLGTDGTYSFVLNNASAAVQGLAAGQTVSQTLTYLITDKDGDQSPASVTIEIKGTADTANVTVSASGVDATVYEAGLTSVADTSETVTGHSFQVSATDGIASVTVGTETFTVAQLQDAAYLASHPIDTGEGTLVVTGYSSADGKTGTVTYDYTLNAAQMHIDNPATPADEGQVLQDSVAVGVSGVGGTAAGANLTINIVDDVPVDARMDGFLRNTGGGELLGTLVDFGADGARASGFVDWTGVSTKITTSSGTTVQSLTSMGENVIITTNGNVVTGTTADGDSVFTITANADGTYGMQLDRAIDTGRLFQTDGTLLTYGDGPIHGYYLYKEGADPLVGFTSGQAPDPNLTLLATFTGTSSGGGGHANEVNISGSGIGIADNNLNVGDTMSIDLADSQNFTAVKVSFAGFNSANSVDYTINYVGGGSSTGTATIANGEVDGATGDMFLQAEAGKVIDSVVLNDVVGSPFKIDGMNFFQTADDKVPSIDLTYKAYDADNDSVTGTVSVTLDASNPVDGSLTLGSAIGGAAGNDDLHGGSGADILTGAGGSDNLWGGAGADTFVFKLSDSPNGTVDTVKDFTKGAGGDTLLFEDVLKVDVSYDSNTGNSTVVAHYADGQAQAVMVEGVQLNEAGTTILASTDHIIKITG